jgi:hypothetical protein
MTRAKRKPRLLCNKEKLTIAALPEPPEFTRHKSFSDQPVERLSGSVKVLLKIHFATGTSTGWNQHRVGPESTVDYTNEHAINGVV